jgi:3-deoxy-D-manno-octulosonic-acid transferase
VSRRRAAEFQRVGSELRTSRLPPRKFEQIARDALYTGAVVAMSPMLLYKFARGKYRTGWGGKLGYVPQRCAADRIWLHAVSVGEAVVMGILAERLRTALPAYEIVISTTTPTGQDVAKKKFGDERSFYLPLDFSGFVRRAVTRTKPNVLILAETEIWPNLIAAATDAGVPVVVVNGRISDRAFPTYQRFARFFKSTMQKISVCAVQTEDYAERFRALGMPDERIVVTGTLKYDGVRTEADHDARTWARDELRIAANEHVLLGGSTHATEEVALARAWKAIPQDAGWRLVIAPRHPDRVGEAEADLAEAGFQTIRRSSLVPGGADALHRECIVLVDTVGELGCLYHAADLVFVGGSLIQHGGQNPIEPAGIGKATVFGPHMFNFAETTELLLASGGALQVEDASRLTQLVTDLAEADDRRAAVGVAGREAIRSKQGAAGRTVALISNVLAAGAVKPHNIFPRC